MDKQQKSMPLNQEKNRRQKLPMSNERKYIITNPLDI